MEAFGEIQWRIGFNCINAHVGEPWGGKATGEIRQLQDRFAWVGWATWMLVGGPSPVVSGEGFCGTMPEAISALTEWLKAEFIGKKHPIYGGGGMVPVLDVNAK